MARLRIEGRVERALELGYEELAALPGQIESVAEVVPGKPGSGVTLAAVLEAAGLGEGARSLHIESGDGSFSATLPLEGLSRAVLAYRLGDEPLPAAKGGPVRFLTPHEGACDKSDGHACANVKDLVLLRVEG